MPKTTEIKKTFEATFTLRFEVSEHELTGSGYAGTYTGVSEIKADRLEEVLDEAIGDGEFDDCGRAGIFTVVLQSVKPIRVRK